MLYIDAGTDPFAIIDAGIDITCIRRRKSAKAKGMYQRIVQPEGGPEYTGDMRGGSAFIRCGDTQADQGAVHRYDAPVRMKMSFPAADSYLLGLCHIGAI